MALSKDTLKSDILAVFQSMTDGDNKKLSEGLSEALKDFLENGEPSTTDIGAVAGGSFSGASTSGSLTADNTACEEIIYAATQSMQSMTAGGDNILADGIASGLQALVLSTECDTDVSGTLTPPPPATPSPMTGKAHGGSGCFVCDTTAVASGLKAFFPLMSPMTSGGDEAFAESLATLFYTCVLNGVLTTQGTGNLSGTTGTGTIS